MSINYTTLFTRLGKIVKSTNELLTLQSTLLTSGRAVEAEYTARPDLVVSFDSTVQGWSSAAASFISPLKSLADATISDPALELATPSTNVATVLDALMVAMTAANETVTKNTANSTVSADGNNTGNGTLTVSFLGSEAILDETLVATCVADQYSGTAAGGERFQVVGYPKVSANNGVKSQGSGIGSLTVVNGASFIPNGDFQADITNWTIDGDITWDGDTAVLFGNGTATALSMYQTITNKLRPRSTYAAGVRLCRVGNMSAGSSLVVNVGSIQVYSADPATLTTSFQQFSTIMKLGDVVDAAQVVEVAWTSASSAGANATIRVDDLVAAPISPLGQVYYAIFRGSVDFVYGDKITVTTANDNAGVFQTFFGRFYGVSLPSAANGTINDSLAT